MNIFEYSFERFLIKYFAVWVILGYACVQVVQGPNMLWYFSLIKINTANESACHNNSLAVEVKEP